MNWLMRRGRMRGHFVVWGLLKINLWKMNLVRGFFLVGVLVFIAGCGSSELPNATHNFKERISELQFQVLPNAPPDRIYQGSGFKIILEGENRAAYDLQQVDVKVVGLDQKYFALSNTEQTVPQLMGRSLANPLGDKEYFEFSGVANQLFENANEYGANYFVKASYRSKMDFADTICLNPNLYDVYDSGCKVETRKSYGGQGAPLAVTDIEEIMYPSGAGGEAEFRIHIANRGQGRVGVVTVGKAQLGNEELTCEFKGQPSNGLLPGGEDTRITLKTVRFTENVQEGVLVCKTFLKDSRSYTTTLSADFGYEYEWKRQFSLRLVR